MLVRVAALCGVPVVPVDLATVGLFVVLAVSQVACQASGGRPSDRVEPHSAASEVMKPVAPAPAGNHSGARREPAGNSRGAPRATAAEMPTPIRGVWQMGDAPCDVPHPDSDGTLTITSKGWQGYEHYGSPASVKPVSPRQWVIEGEEYYLGSQHDHVSKRFALRGSVLTISEPDYAESYSRCKGV